MAAGILLWAANAAGLLGGDAALLDGPAPWREVRIERR